ncbi:MAG: hypothetical protein ACLQVD_07785 [Capsulimonadaceae bacterium]
MTLNVSSQAETRLNTLAEREGLDPVAFVEKLIADYQPRVQRLEQDPTLALFTQWQVEDSRMTTEEAEQEAELWRDFENGINETRRSLGMETL